MSKSPPPAVEVVHSIPGRLRLRLPSLKIRPDLADQILTAVMAAPSVHRARLNLTCASLVIEYDPAKVPVAQVVRQIQQWASRAPARVTTPPAASPAKASAPSLWQRATPLLCSLSGLALSLIGGPIAHGLGLALTALGAVPMVKRAFAALVHEQRLSVDQLDSAAVAVMFLLGDVRSAALMCALVSLGEEIRDRTARRSKSAALELQGALGRSAWLVRGRRKVKVPVDQLRVGDVVVAYPGDLIPVDGVVVEGIAAVDQRTLTGESRPVKKTVSDSVLAATVVTDGKLYIQAQAVGGETRAGWIVQTLNAAPIHDTRATSYANRFADRLVGPTFLLAGAAYALTHSLARVAAILIVDFATGIRVSAPTTILATMTRAAREGILIKSGRALETLAHADAILFDKTGTLTLGDPEVSSVISLDNRFTTREVLAWAAAAEVRLRHPTARAIVQHARRCEIQFPERESSHYTTGLGVEALVEGRRISVGSARYLQSSGIAVEPAIGVAAGHRKDGASIIYIAVDGALAGLIAYSDPPREESAQVVAWLRRHGVKDILMITGDEPAAAWAVARVVGIERVHAAAFPQDKADIVQDLQRRGRTVVVVGDGINDSPALALADVSISLHQGADVAREVADIVLMDPDLTGLVRAIELARHSLRIINQNLAYVAVPNAAALALATVGLLNPMGSTILSNGSTIAAAANSLRPLMGSLHPNGRGSSNGAGALIPDPL